jgi:hypothetical protein
MTSFSGLFLAVSYFVLNFGGFDNECRNYEEKSTVFHLGP